MYSQSQFQTLLKPISHNGQFAHLTRNLSADKYKKTLKTRDLLIQLIFAQLSKSTSLRTLEARFNSHPNHLYHLNTRPIRRASLADALQSRSSAPFIALAQALSAHHARKIRRESKEMLALSDSTSIALNPKLPTFAHSTSRNQGIKLHLLIDAKRQLPLYFDFSPTTTADITGAQHMPIEAGYHYVFDRGYCDYGWWQRIQKQGATFTARLRKASVYHVEKENEPDPNHPHILTDQTIRLHQAPELLLRRIAVKREGELPPVIVSNRLQDGEPQPAAAYKARRGIELLFKWMKQHLNLQSFPGRSENAVRLQILSALIVWFLLNIYRDMHNLSASLHLIFARLSCSLFMREDTHYLTRQKRRRRAQECPKKQSSWLEAF